MIEIYLNDVNVSNRILTKRCLFSDKIGGLLDCLDLSIETDLRINKNDMIIVKFEDVSTGVLYVSDIIVNNQSIDIFAVSAPVYTKQQNTRIWRNILLSEIISDIAKKYSLRSLCFNVSDFRYSCVSQFNENDFSFLNRVLTREGYHLKVSDNSLIVFDDKYLMDIQKKIEISKSDVLSPYKFLICGEPIQRLTVCYKPFFKPLISYTHQNDNNGKSVNVNEYVDDLSQAERFSLNYLNNNNRYLKQGKIILKDFTTVSAGSIVSLKQFGDDIDGNYSCIMSDYDFLKNKVYLSLGSEI